MQTAAGRTFPWKMKNRSRPVVPATLLAVLTLLPLAPAARAQKIEADETGNVYYTDAAGKRTQLTNEGKDADPCLDPGKRRFVYVHRVAGKEIDSGAGGAQPTELRQMDVDGQHGSVLVRSAAGGKPQDILADFSSPTFSPDGRTIYFSSAAWATSGAVHAYDTVTKTVRFVLAGNNPLVVPAGEYKGDLLVEQHRYFLGGGSFDWFWLFKPDGKEIGPVGETTDMFREMYFKEK